MHSFKAINSTELTKNAAYNYARKLLSDPNAWKRNDTGRSVTYSSFMKIEALRSSSDIGYWGSPAFEGIRFTAAELRAAIYLLADQAGVTVGFSETSTPNLFISKDQIDRLAAYVNEKTVKLELKQPEVEANPAELEAEPADDEVTIFIGRLVR